MDNPRKSKNAPRKSVQQHVKHPSQLSGNQMHPESSKGVPIDLDDDLCPGCISRQNEIERLQKELDEVRRSPMSSPRRKKTKYKPATTPPGSPEAAEVDVVTENEREHAFSIWKREAKRPGSDAHRERTERQLPFKHFAKEKRWKYLAGEYDEEIKQLILQDQDLASAPPSYPDSEDAVNETALHPVVPSAIPVDPRIIKIRDHIEACPKCDSKDLPTGVWLLENLPDQFEEVFKTNSRGKTSTKPFFQLKRHSILNIAKYMSIKNPTGLAYNTALFSPRWWRHLTRNQELNKDIDFAYQQVKADQSMLDFNTRAAGQTTGAALVDLNSDEQGEEERAVRPVTNNEEDPEEVAWDQLREMGSLDEASGKQ